MRQRTVVLLAVMLAFAVPFGAVAFDLSDNVSADAAEGGIGNMFDDNGLGNIEITTTLIFAFCILAAAAIVAWAYYSRS